MKLGIINSAFSQAGVDTLTGLKHIARIGFDCVDIFTEPEMISAEERLEIKKFSDDNNLPITSLPVIAIGLIDFNDPVRAFHIQRCKGFIDLAAEWDANNILLVLGEYLWQCEVIQPEDQWRWAIESCRILGDYAETKGVNIALELEPFRLSILASVDSMLRFVNECNHPRVRANIDISHLVLADNGPDEVIKLKDKAIHVHISDCDGIQHGDLPPGRGIVKFTPYLQAIKELEMEGVVSIELEYSPDPEGIVAWVEEAYKATDRLMRLVDLRG
jgi:sugar phosphate isomerase/epimerase